VYPHKCCGATLELFSAPPDEIRWLDKVCRWINEELRQLPKATYQPPSTDADHQIELLLQPKGTTAEQRAKELADKLKQSLLEEVRRFGEPPERFVQMIQQGWTLTQPDKTEVRLDWFDLLCAFFVNTLKTNQEVRAIFEGKLLANLVVESVPITLDQIDQLFSRKVSEEIVQQIQESERRLAQLMAEGFEASRKREEAILDFLRQTFGSQHLVIALQDRTRAFIDRIGTQAFVPREGALQQLENWLTRESGVAILHAPAGYGKTTFLAHLVKASREAGDTRVVYHFFSKDPDLGGYATSLGNALAHLLGQVAAITDSSQSREGLYASAVDPDSRRAQLENTIQELKLAEGERLLIVLDGLDEADETLHPPLRKPLPAGVFVVVSGRWDGAGNPPDYLQHWLEIADEIIPIDAMSASEIAQWLQQAGDGELRAYADDDAFVQQILEKTDGLPLFLDFLLDDLLQAAKQSQNVRQVLHQTPTGFSNYVRQQFRQLAASVGQQPAVRTLFGILSVSKGALREDEIAKLTGLSGWDLAALPSQATRWWRIGGEDGKRTYSFAHPLLAVEFAKVLGSEAERARQSLLAWCAQWQTHKSPYALRHYAEHLREAKQVDALYALARDEAFAHAQGEVIPIAEPEFINEVYLHPTSHIGGTPMSGRKLTVDWKHTAEELYAHYNNTPNTQIARRFQALALLRRGRTLKETAEIVGVSIRTVQKWLTWYRTGGLDELTRRTRGGNRIPVRPLLTPDQQAQLLQHAATQGFRTLREAAAWCRETLGVELSERQVQRLFHRLGFRRKIPRPMAVRADAALQAQWKKGGFARR
jgi:transposase